MSEMIEVTPNVLKCLEILKEAANSLPEGDLKTQAEGALDYLGLTVRGETQPNKGLHCPVEKVVIPPKE